MSYQFGHISTFSRKGNGSNRCVRDVLLEAGRADGATPHVEKPAPPVLLFGIDPAAALDFHDERCARVGRGRGRGQSLRQDSHTLMAGVFSFPCRPDEADTDYYRQLRDDTIAWTRQQIEDRGGEVLGCVQHEDEAFLHIHIYAMNTGSPKLNAKILHPGHVAAAAAATQGKNPTGAYKAAMSGWQSEYNKITSRYGLTRIGPARRRLSRAAHVAEMTEASRQAVQLRELDKRETKISTKEKELVVAKAEATAAIKTTRAIATGMGAWAADEIDENIDFARTVTSARRFQLLGLIAPARAIVVSVLQRLTETARRMTVENQVTYKEEIKSAVVVLEQTTEESGPTPG